MKLRDFILLGALGLTSCATQERRESLQVTTSQPPKPNSFQEAIERELRKQGPWVEEYVVTDYRHGRSQPDRHLSLQMLSLEFTRRLQEAGKLPFAAAYNDEKDLLLIPQPIDDDPDRTNPILDAIDHELWHSLYDETGKRGLLHNSSVSGPSLEEIAAYTSAKTSTPAFTELRNTLRTFEEYEKFKSLFSKVVLDVNSFNQSTNAFHATLNEAEKEKEELQPYLNQDNQMTIEERIDLLGQKIIDYAQQIQRISGYALSLEEKIKKKEISLAELLKEKETAAALVKDLEAHQNLPREINGLRINIEDMYTEARMKKFEKMIEDRLQLLENTKDPKERKDLQTSIETLRFLQNQSSSNRLYSDFIESLNELHDTFAHVSSSVISRDNTYQIDAILNNPDEVVARITDSLNSLYTGPVTQNKFPLDEKDLRFLGRFTISRNGKREPLFRKSLEKYRLGLQMIAEGFSSDHTRELLEYATSVTYDGKTYAFPESNITFYGTIPVLERTKSSELTEPKKREDN